MVKLTPGEKERFAALKAVIEARDNFLDNTCGFHKVPQANAARKALAEACRRLENLTNGHCIEFAVKDDKGGYYLYERVYFNPYPNIRHTDQLVPPFT